LFYSVAGFKYWKKKSDGKITFSLPRKADWNVNFQWQTYVVLAEENLLDITTGEGAKNVYQSYSTSVHEFAHAMESGGLSAIQRKAVIDQYNWKKGNNKIFTDGLWKPTVAQQCYASTDFLEYYAQAVTAYIGLNYGIDPVYQGCSGPAASACDFKDQASCSSPCSWGYFPRYNTREFLSTNEKANFNVFDDVLAFTYREHRVCPYPPLVPQTGATSLSIQIAAKAFQSYYGVVVKDEAKILLFTAEDKATPAVPPEIVIAKAAITVNDASLPTGFTKCLDLSGNRICAVDQSAMDPIKVALDQIMIKL